MASFPGLPADPVAHKLQTRQKLDSVAWRIVDAERGTVEICNVMGYYHYMGYYPWGIICGIHLIRGE
jgi:hypothetical protein